MSTMDLVQLIISGEPGLREERTMELISLVGVSHAVSLIREHAISLRPTRRYIYMLTLTLDPSRHPADTEELLSEIERKIEEIPSRRRALSIVKWAYAREHTAQGRAHWHICVESTHSLEKDNFKYFAQKYGNIDFSRNRAQNPETVLNYISKETQPTIILWN